MCRTASNTACEDTKDLMATAALLGHSDPEVTRKHYAWASQEVTDRAADAVGRALFGG